MKQLITCFAAGLLITAASQASAQSFWHDAPPPPPPAQPAGIEQPAPPSPHHHHHHDGAPVAPPYAHYDADTHYGTLPWLMVDNTWSGPNGATQNRNSSWRYVPGNSWFEHRHHEAWCDDMTPPPPPPVAQDEAQPVHPHHHHKHHHPMGNVTNSTAK